MKKIIYLLLISGFALFLNACYYDKAELLYPTTGVLCDTTGVISYTQKVVPILQSQCYGCHSTTGGSGGINMGNYANDKAIALNGKLYGSMSMVSGFSPMPKGGNKMSSCDLAFIKKWINSGCLNN